MNKIYECDINGICPYNAVDGMACRNCCGLGVDEDIPEMETEEDLDEVFMEEEIDDPDYEPDYDETGYNPYIGGYDFDC